MNARRLVVFGMLGLALPGLLSAQKREDILSIQRDVAQVQDQLKQMQASQDQKMDAIQSALKQALEESAKLSAALAAMQKNVNDRLADQQAKVVAPVATLGTKVDELSNDTRSIRENVADLATRLGKLDNKLEDISSAVRTLNQPTNVAPPPPAGAAPGAAAGAAMVFLAITTELTATLILAPTGTRTLATTFWSLTSEIEYVAAAPYALLMIVLSLPLTWVLYHQSRRAAGR